MPSAIVTGETCLLTSHGWAYAGASKDPASLFGTDRRGHLVSQEVRLTFLETLPKTAIVGTDASVGIFAPETRLTLRDGIVKEAREVVEDQDARDHWFENVLTYPPLISGGLPGDLFFDALTGAASFVLDEVAVIRCRSRDVPKWETASNLGCCRFVKVSDDVFCLISATDFRQVRGHQVQHAIRALSEALWRNSEELCEEFDYTNLSCCLWYASTLTQLKVGYVLVYDTLQHSLLIKVVKDSSHMPPFRRCRCAFYRSVPNRKIRITWESSFWTPIASGFLISGR